MGREGFQRDLQGHRIAKENGVVLMGRNEGGLPPPSGPSEVSVCREAGRTFGQRNQPTQGSRVGKEPCACAYPRQPVLGGETATGRAGSWKPNCQAGSLVFGFQAAGALEGSRREEGGDEACVPRWLWSSQKHPVFAVSSGGKGMCSLCLTLSSQQPPPACPHPHASSLGPALLQSWGGHTTLW